jgi:hypothetical protein
MNTLWQYEHRGHMNDTHKAPDGRTIHHWHGQDRQADTTALADCIARAVPGLYDYGGRIVQLDEAGGLNVVNFEKFRSLVEKHIAGIRCVRNGAGWQRQLFPYEFAPAVRYDPVRGGPTPPPDNRLPDSKVLTELYQGEVLSRLPKAID